MGVASEVLDTTSTAILRMNAYDSRPQQGIATFPLRSSPIVAFRVMWETWIARYAWLSTKDALQFGKELSVVWRYKTWAIRHHRAADRSCSCQDWYGQKAIHRCEPKLDLLFRVVRPHSIAPALYNKLYVCRLLAPSHPKHACGQFTGATRQLRGLARVLVGSWPLIYIDQRNINCHYTLVSLFALPRSPCLNGNMLIASALSQLRCSGYVGMYQR